MRKILAVALGAALMLAGAALAQPRDTPPPGCRWFGDDLGCKDGRGNYRRAGDDAVIGRYAAAPRPKPKPKPRPAAAAIPAETPPSESDLAIAPATEAGVPPVASNRFPLNVDGSVPSSPDAQSPEPAVEPPPAEPMEPTAAPPKPKPWWQAFWDWLVNDFMGLLRRLGLAK